MRKFMITLLALGISAAPLAALADSHEAEAKCRAIAEEEGVAEDELEGFLQDCKAEMQDSSTKEATKQD